MHDAHFTTRLLDWYDQHGRKHLPWHFSTGESRHPAYGIWVSEIMLQQTQVSTVVPYYQRFMAHFPNIPALAEAPEDDVLHYWSGLGYYARARNLHKAARLIVTRHGGQFPTEFDAARALPGIGRSTAGAILAFSFHQRHPILDGNVKRVLTRYHGIEGYPGKREVETRLWGIADHHTPDKRVADYTQAIMDFGATLCTRTKPDCAGCPQQSSCFAFQNHRVSEFPAKKPKPQQPRRHEHCYMLVLVSPDGLLGLQKRPARGIWGGLFCFPQFDTLDAVSDWLHAHQLTADNLESGPPHLIEHRFTHFDLNIEPLYLHLSPKDVKPDLTVWYNPHQPEALGLPAPVEQIIQSL